MVQPGGQQVDLVLPRSQSQDHMFERQMWEQAGPSKFNFPTDIATDEERNVYVTDILNARVQVFNADGQFLRQWGKLERVMNFGT
jgi:hypothetical protein